MHSLYLLALSSLVIVVNSLPYASQRSSSSYVALPFSRRQSTQGSGLRRRAFTSPLANEIDLHEYYIEVEIGTPPQTIDLVLDTGSSEIWAYDPEACSNCTAQYCEEALQSIRLRADPRQMIRPPPQQLYYRKSLDR